MHFKTYLVAGVVSMLPLAAAAQQMHKIYLDPNRPFTPYFSAALQKKKVPVTVTVDPTQADYMARFQINTNNGSIFEGITRQLQYGMYNAGASARVTMSIIDVKSKDVVFSYTCRKPNRYSGQRSEHYNLSCGVSCETLEEFSRKIAPGCPIQAFFRLEWERCFVCSAAPAYHNHGRRLGDRCR